MSIDKRLLQQSKALFLVVMRQFAPPVLCGRLTGQQRRVINEA